MRIILSLEILTLAYSFLVPSISPVINVTASQRDRLEVTLTEIPTTTWNGVPLGYRVYYQSVLKLKNPGSLEMPYVTSTYNHINFTVNVNFTERGNFSYPIVLKNLEVFSNYSILAAAYSGAGVGPFMQVFWRTNQGGIALLFRNKIQHLLLILRSDFYQHY